MLAAALLSATAQNARSAGGGAAASSAKTTAPAAAPIVVDETQLGFGDAGGVASKNDPSSIWTILRTLVALAVVAAAVYGVVYLLKRLNKQADAKDPHLKVLATAHLGSNRFVHVVSLGQKAWVIGASDGGVDLIAEVDDAETKDALFLEDSRRQAEQSSAFSLDFKALMRKLGAGEKANAASGAESIRKRRERLRGL